MTRLSANENAVGKPLSIVNLKRENAVVMNQKEVANALEEVAVLLELKGENPFKIRAYNQASRAVLGLEGDLAAWVEEGKLAQVKGIGKATTANISELVETGRMSLIDELKAEFPEGFLDLLSIPGLGPKKIKTLKEKLEIGNLGELEYACHENRLVALKGFGAKTQAKILKGIENLKQYRGRFLWAEVENAALDFERALTRCPAVDRVQLAGSFRRSMETLKDLDLVVATHDPGRVIEYLKNMDTVASLESGGDTKLTLRLANGMNADLRLVPEESFPFALLHFTGSKEHNTQARNRAKSKGLKLNEYGLFDTEASPLPAPDEEAIYARLGLAFIPPELREGLGEIEAAAENGLPDLIRVEDIKGIFHVHSNFSDGGMSIAEIVSECRKMGIEYVGLTDHSRSAFYAGGLTVQDIDRQFEEIEHIRNQYPDFGLFWGIESDILTDGSLDYPDDILARFDFIIASIHSNFNLPEDRMTNRLVKAVQNPYTTILGHPTGRLLLAREPYALDLGAVLEAAAREDKIVEINANPHRLDLDWREMRKAKGLNLKTIICPDAHSPEGLRHIRHGVQVARKGWLSKEDVLNCLDRNQMAAYLKKVKSERVIG